jgi:CheY-like chemotaxis protein
MLVDDEPTVRSLLAKWLRASGYEVIEAANGHEAIEVALQSLPQLIVMDVKLPDMTGFATTEHIRKLSGFKTIPVICLTGLDMRIDVAHEGGCTDLLLKPVERGELLRAVHARLKSH